MDITNLLQEKKNIVFVGESGCGKTELSLNLAVALAKKCPGRVNLIDMDQTKGMFRSTDYKDAMSEAGVKLVCGEHFLDSPIVPPGVERLLTDDISINVMDVGGNETGAIKIGQFDRVLENDTIFYMVVNPYRALSCDAQHINDMKLRIMRFGGITDVNILVNPHVGDSTDKDFVLQGYEDAKKSIAEMGMQISAVVIPSWLSECKSLIDSDNVYTIERYIQYP